MAPENNNWEIAFQQDCVKTEPVNKTRDALEAACNESGINTENDEAYGQYHHSPT